MTVTSKKPEVIADRGERWVEVGEAAEAFIEILNANGVEYIFLMPGTDTFPIQEALAKYQALGKDAPKVVTALHEIMAMAAAHGYFMVTGKPQVCLVHVDVGLQMIGGMLHNAQRGRAGVIVCSGRTPITARGELRGGRSREVHWIQDRQDQPGVARDYVKWYYELTRTENMNHVMQRAFQIASAEPTGPVYMSFLREMLMEQLDGFSLLPPERYPPPEAGVPDGKSLEAVADAILGSKRPIIIAGYVGRTKAGFDALGDFATETGIPVFVKPERVQISSDHPMFMGTEPGQYLEDADLVLLLDVDVPYIPTVHRPNPDATVIQIDIDPLKSDFPVWGFPIDTALSGNTALTLPALQGLIDERSTVDHQKAISIRFDEIEEAHKRRLVDLEEAALATAGRDTVTVEYLSYCIAKLVDDETIVVDDAITSGAIAARYIPMRQSGSYLKHGGSSMGWGAGASIGVKLAAPDKTVISLNADGNFLDGAPEAALWAAAAYDAPFLTVIYNNSQYAAVKNNMLADYPDGYAARSGNFPGVEIPDTPDFQYIAKACGAYGEKVVKPGDVEAALNRGMAAVKNGQAAVIDVAVEGP